MTLPTLDDFDPHSATLDHVLIEHARTRAAKRYVLELATGRETTFGQLDDLTRRVASGLDSIGIAPGAHVAILMDNCTEQLLAIFGTIRSGRVAVPINSAAKGQLLAYFIGRADCTAIFVERALHARLLEIVDSLPAPMQVVVVDPACDTTSARTSAAPAVAFDELLATPPAARTTASPAFDALALLMFTSGTTGPSKAIMFCQAQFVYWGTEVAFHHEYTADDTAYVFLPLFHGNALLGATMATLLSGASIALARRFSMTAFWSDVRRSGATVFNCVGSVVSFLWNAPGSDDDRTHSLKRCHTVPVPSFAAQFEQRFGLSILSAYGLTDYCLGAAFNTRSDRAKLGSAGQVRRNVQLRIVDEQDLELPVGMAGEILMRQDKPWAASLGYYKQPEVTLASRRNLWFHTGDRGYVDADGYVWYTDRIKDAIRRRGENISAWEVEQVIATHPAISEVAVYPVRSESSEDEVAVSVTLKPGEAWSPDALIQHCNRNLAYFMVPRYVDVMDTMPLTLSLKIEKYKLKQQAEADLARLWDRERAGVEVVR